MPPVCGGSDVNIRDLLEKFVPSHHVERMQQTEPGRLAWALEEVLYAMHSLDYTFPRSDVTVKNYRIPEMVPVRDLWGDKKTPTDVGALLRTIRQYLEACALREVLK